MVAILEFMIDRREKLRTHPQSAGEGVDVGSIGNRTTAHLNLTTPLQPIQKPSIAITRGKKK